MRVVVVGCNGFIGGAVVKELNNLGIETLGIAYYECAYSAIQYHAVLKQFYLCG
jgi:nucleoside-diphosphate-sugar epimerase